MLTDITTIFLPIIVITMPPMLMSSSHDYSFVDATIRYQYYYASSRSPRCSYRLQPRLLHAHRRAYFFRSVMPALLFAHRLRHGAS